MSIYQTSTDDLALLVSAAIGFSVPATHYSIIGIMPTPSGESPYNTKIRIKFGPPSIYVGEKTLYYDRLNLADLDHLHPFTDGRLKARAGPGISVSGLFPALRDGLGINFTVADLEETIATEDEGGAQVILRAKPTSPGWYGEYTAKMSPYQNFSILFFSTTLSGY